MSALPAALDLFSDPRNGLYIYASSKGPPHKVGNKCLFRYDSISHAAPTHARPGYRSIIHTDLKPENVLLDLPPRPPPDSEQPPPLKSRAPKVGAAVKGVAATIDDLNTALSLADEHGLTVEERRKLKKKVRGVGWTRCSSNKTMASLSKVMIGWG